MDAINLKAPIRATAEVKSQFFARASVLQSKLHIDGKAVEENAKAGKAVEVSLSDIGKLLRKKSKELSNSNEADTGPSGISNALRDLKRIGESIQKNYDTIKELAPQETTRVAAELELEDLKGALSEIVNSDAFKNAKTAIEKLVKDYKSGTGISNDTKRALEASKDFLGGSFSQLVSTNSVAAIEAYGNSLNYIAAFDPKNEDLTATEVEEFNLSVETIERIDAGDSYHRADQGNIIGLLKDLRTAIDKGLTLVDKRDAALTKQGDKDPKDIADKENQLDGLNDRVKAALSSNDLTDFIKLLKNIVKNVEDGHLTLKRAAHVAEFYEHRFGKGLVNLLNNNSLLQVKNVLSSAESLYGIAVDGKSNRDTLVSSRTLVKGLIDQLKIDPFKVEKKKEGSDENPLSLAAQRAKAAGDALESLFAKMKQITSAPDDQAEQDNLQPHRLDHLRAKALLFEKTERIKEHDKFQSDIAEATRQ